MGSVFKKFAKNKDGNIAMLTALMLVPGMALLGAGVDYMRAATMANKLQSSLDGAVLAAANLNNPTEVTTVVAEFISANMSREDKFRQTINVAVVEDINFNSKEVAIVANGTLDTYFLPLVGVDELPVGAQATAQQSVRNIEIAMALDISSSMNGNKLANLKDAAEDFVEEMLDDETFETTSISVVPFGGSVNIGEDLFNEFVVPMASATVNPSEADYDIGSDIEDGDFRFTEGDYCLEYVKEDYDDAKLPAASRPQLPHFWRWWNFNPWCPDATSGAVFNSNDRDALIDHIRDMTLSDGTGMDIGAMWALKALSPEWEGDFGGDFDERPAPYDDETLKVYIVMTDGAITQQNRPEDYSYYNVHTDRPDNNPVTTNVSNQGNRSNMQTSRNRGSTSNTSASDTAIGRFKNACETAKENGAITFTIGFQISDGSVPDQLLEECASDPSKYFFVEGLDIDSAFDTIAATVHALRITG